MISIKHVFENIVYKTLLATASTTKSSPSAFSHASASPDPSGNANIRRTSSANPSPMRPTSISLTHFSASSVMAGLDMSVISSMHGTGGGSPSKHRDSVSTILTENIEQEELPDGWKEHFDPTTKRPFYVHKYVINIYCRYLKAFNFIIMILHSYLSCLMNFAYINLIFWL